MANPKNLAIGLGCDWFQPYKHVNYSVGALYIFFYNLPREERMKLENVVLLGLIPGPSEPKKVMNLYLGPFVNDMLQFWEGVPLWHECTKQLIPIRMALLSVMCDIPTTRKLCGFAGHSAALGCSKCLKKFSWSSTEKKLDFSGYDKDSWVAGTNAEYKVSSELYLHAPTKRSKLFQNMALDIRCLSNFHILTSPLIPCIIYCWVQLNICLASGWTKNLSQSHHLKKL